MRDDSNFDSPSFYAKQFLKLSTMGGDIRRVFMQGQKLQQEDPLLNIIDLSLGNPDLEPPREFNEALIKLIQINENGSHRYMDSAGLLNVREFLANELSAKEGVNLGVDNVYLTIGAAGALQILYRLFLDKDDEVVLFAPFFPEYISYTENYFAKSIIVNSDENHNPIIEDFEKKLTSKTKIVIINNPNNPTGIIYKNEIINDIITILNDRRKKYGQIIQLISDEPYSRVVYNDKISVNILSRYEFSWIIRSFSKDLGLAGERIGFIAWKKQSGLNSVIGDLRNASRVIGLVSAPRIMQRIIPYIYNLKVDVSIYQKRVESFISILAKAGIHTAMPAGGFFVFPNTPDQDDRKFCDSLVQKCGVLCVPGTAFGKPGFFRASLTQDQSLIEEAARRILELI